MIAITLQNFIDKEFKGVKSHFAQHYGIHRQNVNTMIKKGYIVIDGELYRPATIRK